MNDIMKTIQYAVNLVILCLPVWLSLASVPAVGGITVRSSRQIGKDNFTFIPSMTLQLQERHQNQPNNITLSCRNATLDLTSADFWLLQNTAGSIPQDLTTINITYMYSTDKAVISFTLRPEIEGYFFCGNIAAMEKSSNNLTLLAYPTPHENYVNCYSASVNESIVLPCPFSRGRLQQYYTIYWVHNYITIFRSVDLNSTERGFIVNLDDFSLSIQSITPSHEGMYECQVEVANPLGNRFHSPSSVIRLMIQENDDYTSMCYRSTTLQPPRPSSNPTNSYYIPTTKTSVSRRRGFPTLFVIAGVSIITPSLPICCVVFALNKWRKRCKTHYLIAHQINARQEVPVEEGTLDQEHRRLNVNGSGQHELFSGISIPAPDQGSAHEVSAREVEPDRGSGSSNATLTPCTQRCTVEVVTAQTPNSQDEETTCISAVLTVHHENNGTPTSAAPTMPHETNGTASVETSTTQTHDPPNMPISVVSGSDLSLSTPNGRRNAPNELVLQQASGQQQVMLSRNSTQAQLSCLSSGTWTSPTHALSGLMMSTLSPNSRDRSFPGQSAETLNLLQPIDDFQDQSINFVFLGSTQLLVCDSSGGKYEVADQGIVIRIPPKALDEEACVEVGVVIHGSFRFPDDRQPISSMVWLTVKNKTANFVFKKQVEIHLPHFLDLSQSDIENRDNDELGLGFLVTDEEMDDREQLILSEGPAQHVVYQQRHAKIKTNHFCFFCLSAKVSVIAERSLYLLTQVLPKTIDSLQWDFHFYVSYSLDSFVKMIKDRHPNHDVESTGFGFTPSSDESLELMIGYKPSPMGWRIALQNHPQVKRSGIHSIWKNDVSYLQAKLKLKGYPPRISATVSGESAFENITAIMVFEGSCDEGKMAREINFTLPKEYVDNNQERLQFLRSQSQPDPHTKGESETALVKRSASEPYPATEMPDVPSNFELVEVARKILAKFPSWKILMCTLKIPEEKCEAILQEDRYVMVQILRMLNTWKELHSHSGTCTRANLAATLRQTDQSLAPAAKILEAPPKDYLQQCIKQ